jgi:hypothetical protein
VAQVDPEQQGSPPPPQVPQVPFVHASPVALQAPPQQSWPVPPQLTHLPRAQASFVASAHVSPSQQASFGPPHAAHEPFAPQVAPD